MKKILITGGAGFIGSNFANKTLDKYDCTVLDNLFLGKVENLSTKIKFIQGDACNPKDLEKCGTDFDAIIHLAGTSSAPMFNDDGLADGYVNSIESFVRTLDFARQNGINKFIYASTSSLYGNNPIPLLESQNVIPPNHYSVTKFCYEHCARCYAQVYPEMDIVGFRFMSIYGLNEEAKGQFANMISQFIWDISREISPVIYGDGSQFRDFTNVADIVQGISLVIDSSKKLGYKIYNIGRGASTSFNDIFEVITEKIPTKITPKYITNPVKEGYIQGQHADINLISNELGFVPKIDLETGISEIIDNLDIKKIKETSSEIWWKNNK